LKLKALVITFLFAAGVVASVAVAKGPPPGKGKNKDDDTAAVSTGSTTEDKKKNRPAAACRPTVTFDLKGKFVSASTGTTTPTTGTTDTGPTVLGAFDMDVTSANKHGRRYVGETVTVSYDRTTSFRRRGHADIEDFVAGDRLNVKVRACKTATTTAPAAGTTAAPELLLARKVDGKPAKTPTTTTPTTPTTTTTAP
jgi:hypothetical protein